jgi:hypothetical protein
MTIGEFVERRISLIRILSLLWFAVPVLLIFAFPVTAQTHGIEWLLLSYVLMWAICAVIAWKSTCPRCHSTLFWETVKATRLWFGPTLKSCPKCRVNFDEPMHTSENGK